VIGGVPEHFNLPWLKLIEAREPEDAGVSARWEDYAGGTGAMVSALNDRALDVAMLLTEGAVSGIGKGGQFRIVSLFTQTPLVWGVHVPARSTFQSVDDIQGARYAISRIGSGSHLMSYAHARSHGWPTDDLHFNEVGSLDGTIAAFERDEADVFLWERFMTKPVVDSGRFRRIDEFAAPWPAFVICVSQHALQEKRDGVAVLLEQIFPRAQALHFDRSAPAQIADRYGLLLRDAEEWLGATRWAPEQGVDPAVIDRVADALVELGLLKPQGNETFTARIQRRQSVRG
jgi:ABC-type nitrate/sulfonate/bicarbonate transport system substrate-binding protein